MTQLWVDYYEGEIISGPGPRPAFVRGVLLPAFKVGATKNGVQYKPSGPVVTIQQDKVIYDYGSTAQDLDTSKELAVQLVLGYADTALTAPVPTAWAPQNGITPYSRDHIHCQDVIAGNVASPVQFYTQLGEVVTSTVADCQQALDDLYAAQAGTVSTLSLATTAIAAAGNPEQVEAVVYETTE